MDREYKYDLVVMIGRFQPFHIGHEMVLKKALDLGKDVLVLVGSPNAPATPKNPWSVGVRQEMILQTAGELEAPFATIKRVHIDTANDYLYNDQQWVLDVQNKVKYYASILNIGEPWSDKPRTKRIGIIGHKKDDSSYYLDLFPQWELIEHDLLENISATEIRKICLERGNLKFIEGVVPPPVLKLLAYFTKTKEFQNVVDEYEFIKKYKRGWESSPYPPTFVTTDAIVVQAGHILLVERGAMPGVGLLALPGGFVHQDETLEQGVIRELREETKIKVPAPVLKGNIKKTRVFDFPERSSRGRTITHGFFIELPAGPLPSVKGGVTGPLPSVKGGDDARKAKWVPISDVKEQEMFEDHYHIIRYFLGEG